MTKAEVLAALSSIGAAPSRFRGQNFLTDANMLRKLAECCDLGPRTRVLEIGPGLGAFTRLLCQRASSVRAVELDRALAAYLPAALDRENFTLVEGDILQIGPELFRDIDCIVGNLPYNIASAILFRLMDLRIELPLYTLVQWEMAERMVAGPGSRDYGILAVLLGSRFKITVKCKVPPTCFYPAPKVVSAFVLLSPLEHPKISPTLCPWFTHLVRKVFSQRRKMLRNSLALAFNSPVQAAKAEVLLSNRYGMSILERRPESFSIEEFAAFTELLEQVWVEEEGVEVISD